LAWERSRALRSDDIEADSSEVVSIRPRRASGTTAFRCRTGSRARLAPKNRHAGQVKCIALLTVSVDEQGSNQSTRRRLIYAFTTPVFVGWARAPFQQQLDDACLLLA
jgi:hypothetical protein